MTAQICVQIFVVSGLVPPPPPPPPLLNKLAEKLLALKFKSF